MIIISAKSMTTVLIQRKSKNALLERDYLFQSVSRKLNLERIDEIMTHMIDVNIVAVQMFNSTNKSVIIFRKIRLDRFIECEEHDCYATDAAETSLAVESFWHKIFALIEIQIDMKNVHIDMKKKFSNEIIAYEIFKVRQQLFDVVEKYSLWDKIENTMINVFENEWMSIILKSEIRIEIVKMY
jgi:hypothetical protein